MLRDITFEEGIAIVNNHPPTNETFALLPIRNNRYSVQLTYVNGKLGDYVICDHSTGMRVEGYGYLGIVKSAIVCPEAIPYQQGTITVYGSGDYINFIGDFEFTDFSDVDYSVSNFSDRINVLSAWGFTTPVVYYTNFNEVVTTMRTIQSNFPLISGICVCKDKTPRIDLYGTPFFAKLEAPMATVVLP